ncbi:SatD family protein [Intrasporangium sp. YIM S08009]|uniref:SatD family protein n=1 Tax=Intrasporangium zincisolvens TaxID=3080018 RepID=UPI002B05F59F|nr:SatD family protein [Intrasporangium sp. YIM S08009]
MTQMKVKPSPVVLIGDVVDSRLHPDRQQLHDALEAAIGEANASSTPLDPLVITLGDEFQGVFATVGDALTASFRVRAHLHPLADVRFGVGRGEVSTLDPVRGVHDGPGYWAARDAIVEIEERATQPRSRTARTGYSPGASDAGEAGENKDALDTVTALRVALDCLDFMVGSMSTTTRDILGGLMDGQSQRDVATRLDISASAVSQRVRRDGVGVALDAMAALGRLS